MTSLLQVCCVDDVIVTGMLCRWRHCYR